MKISRTKSGLLEADCNALTPESKLKALDILEKALSTNEELKRKLKLEQEKKRLTERALKPAA